MKTVKEFEAQISWLKNFIARWDANELEIAEAHCKGASKEYHELLGNTQNNMIDEYSKYCSEQNLTCISADELVSELEDQKGCTEDGKF